MWNVIAAISKDAPIDTDVLSSTLGDLANVMEFDFTTADIENLPKNVKNTHAILSRVGDINAKLLEVMPKLEVVVSHGVGVDHIDLAEATKRNVWVTNTPTGNSISVAEVTLNLMLTLLHRTYESTSILQNEKDWDKARVIGQELNGKTVGIVGYGNSGRRVAKLCSCFGAKVIVSRASKKPLDEGMVNVSLEKLFQTADIISLHLPLNAETKGMINGALLRKVKPGVLLINVSRSLLINESSLGLAIREGSVGGVAVDVYENEPPNFNSLYFNSEKILTTAHIAGYTSNSLRRIAKTAAQDIINVHSKKRPYHPVNDL